MGTQNDARLQKLKKLHDLASHCSDAVTKSYIVCDQNPIGIVAMADTYEIRANFNSDSLVIYQAYPLRIAQPALTAQRFVSPFSFNRMTWIKPSFLWLMHRSNWGQKGGQDMTLAVRIRRAGWDKALSLGVLTHPEPRVDPDPSAWKKKFDAAHVHIQWDTERSFRGSALNHYSIQVGISRHMIQEYVDDWIVSIEDMTPVVTKIRKLIREGKSKEAKRHLPSERVYSVPPEIAANLMIGT